MFQVGRFFCATGGININTSIFGSVLVTDLVKEHVKNMFVGEALQGGPYFWRLVNH